MATWAHMFFISILGCHATARFSAINQSGILLFQSFIFSDTPIFFFSRFSRIIRFVMQSGVLWVPQTHSWGSSLAVWPLYITPRFSSYGISSEWRCAMIFFP